MTWPTMESSCDTHGAFEAREYLPGRWTGCPVCLDLERQRKKEELAAAERADRVQSLLRASGIPPRYRDKTLAATPGCHPRHQEALGQMRAYFAKFPWETGAGLFLVGPPGTGKTSMACALVKATIEAHAAPCHISTGRNLIRRLRATWERDSQESETDVIDCLSAERLLVIDEIGVGFGTEAEQVHLYDIVSARYDRQRPTVLLSNLEPAEIRRVVGERCYDRLREGATLIVANWPSYREAAQ